MTKSQHWIPHLVLRINQVSSDPSLGQTCLSTRRARGCSFIKPKIHGLSRIPFRCTGWLDHFTSPPKSGYLLPSATSLRQFFLFVWLDPHGMPLIRTRPKPLWNIRTCQLTRIGLSQQCPLEWPWLSWWLTRNLFNLLSCNMDVAWSWTKWKHEPNMEIKMPLHVMSSNRELENISQNTTTCLPRASCRFLQSNKRVTSRYKQL